MFSRKFISRSLKVGIGLTAFFQFYPKTINKIPEISEETKQIFRKKLPKRDDLYKTLNDTEEFDVLIIGGGATGCGVALDSSTRGLKTCLVEKFDFASGTSSRSTKLIHGGVRYLQKAIFELNYEQFKMVNEALGERACLINNAPHLTGALPIMLPLYKLWQIPYYWFGIKAYDVISGFEILKASYFLNKAQALEKFPLLKKYRLKGAIVYYDGQMDDARFCLSLALSAIRNGAVALNYTECTNLISDGKKIQGVKVRDRLTGKEFVVKAKCVINATGPYTDSIRKLDGKETKEICQPSSGVHILLPDYYSPSDMGLLDPNTSDGRVIFFLPWLKGTLAGTTDTPCLVLDHPQASEREVSFILQEIQAYFSSKLQVRRSDVLSAWSGVRPLVLDPNSKDTQSIARNHIIEISPTGLVTIAGGKWTTYRLMAEETMDRCVDTFGLVTRHGCCTRSMPIEGAHEYQENGFITLVQDYGLDVETAKHLYSTYGDKSSKVASLSMPTGKIWPIFGVKLHPNYPFLESEIIWACNEYACRAVDFLARRIRLAFLDVNAAIEVLPRVVQIMGDELNWSKAKRVEELEHAMNFLRTEMGYNLQESYLSYTPKEISKYHKEFSQFDKGKNGYINLKEAKEFLKAKNVSPILIEQSLDKYDNEQITLSDFLKIIQSIKELKEAMVQEASKRQVERPTIDRMCGDL